MVKIIFNYFYKDRNLGNFVDSQAGVKYSTYTYNYKERK